MRILITGSTGFIGSHIRELLKKRQNVTLFTTSRTWPHGKEYEVATPNGGHILSRLDNTFQAIGLFQKTGPIDIIVNCMGEPRTKVDPLDINASITGNLVALNNLLHNATEGCRLIHLSTVNVYGEEHKNFTERLCCCPTSLYAITKLAGEHLINTVYGQKLRSTILRLATTIGIGSSHGAFPEILAKLHKPGPISLLGSRPGKFRQFIHISDVERAISFCIDNFTQGCYNISSDTSLNVEQFTDIMMKALGIYKEKEFEGGPTHMGYKGCFAMNGPFKTKGFKYLYETSEDAVTQAVRECHEAELRRVDV